MSDLLISGGIGVFAGITLIILLQYNPGEPFDYSQRDKEDSEDKNVDEQIKTVGEMTTQSSSVETISDDPVASSEEYVRRTEKLQKLLGVSSDQVRDAVEDARSGKGRNRGGGEGLGWIKFIEWIIFLGLIFGLLYFSNLATDGDLGRIICGLFPREMKLLGFKEYLEHYSDHKKQHLYDIAHRTHSAEL